MRAALIVLLLILPFSYAANDTTEQVASAGANIPLERVTLNVYDAATQEPIPPAHIIVEYGKTRILRYVLDSTITSDIPSGVDVVVKVDIPDTPGKDYYANVRTEESTNVPLLPVGSVHGTVAREGMVFSGADIKADCSGIYGEKETKTDSYGTFQLDWLPPGECTVHAQEDGTVGREKVTIETGKLSETSIELDEAVKKQRSSWLPILLVFLVIAAIIMWFARPKKREPKQEKKKENTRFSDVVETLNERDREIAHYLKDNGTVSQSKLVHELSIPKTSIARILAHLEAKNVLEIQKAGKAKRIKLTDWILGKN
ncbi:MAG: hypothetical protein ABIA93_00210 [Candidatus Woesearchaeota archaeon]